MVTHVVTCQGRDHIVNIRSRCQILVVVNIHFIPELTLRSLRESLRLIIPHWPLYPDALGVITGDFNICEAEEGRFNGWNQTFTDGDTGKSCPLPFLFPLNLVVVNVHFEPDPTLRSLRERLRLTIP